MFYLITNPRIVTMTVQHQDKLLFDYSFSAEYPRKRRVFNSESHQPCTLMTTMKITAVSLARHFVSVCILQSQSEKHKQEETPDFLLYQTGMCLGMWTAPERPERNVWCLLRCQFVWLPIKIYGQAPFGFMMCALKPRFCKQLCTCFILFK